MPLARHPRVSRKRPGAPSTRLRAAGCWALLALSLTLSACSKPAEDKDAQAREAAYKEKYAKAKALFEERCKTAGVVVKRTVKDVEGIELAKIRQPIPWGGKEYFDPLYPEAAMAGEHRGDDYIKQFLMTEFPSVQPGGRGVLGPPTEVKLREQPGSRRGYAFVEYVDPKDGRRLHCVPDWSLQHTNWVDGQHQCSPSSAQQARYALDYEDLIDVNDRALWIAGTRLKVIDRKTGEVIAQLVKYVWDPGFGNSATGRWPWSHAYNTARTSCPVEPERLHGFDSRYFLDAVLIPKQGE